MEALRNYGQHRGFPIHTVTFNSKLVKSKSGEKLLFSLTLYIRLADLEEDKKFKKSVLKDLKPFGDKIDIMPLMRDYIASLGHILEKIREVLRADVHDWEQTILDAVNRFREKHPQESSIVGLAAVVKNDDGTYRQPVQLFNDFIEYRQQLETKNSNLGTLARRCVTSQVIEPDA